MADLEFRPIDSTEVPEFFLQLEETFGEDPRGDDRDRFAAVFEPKRSLAGFDRGRIVATAGIFSLTMTVPGGPRPVAGVTVVSVAPTHRRRGALTEMMRRQLTGLHDEHREPAAALWASEGAIYGRFGYGLGARRGRLTVRRRELRLRPGVGLGDGRIQMVRADEARRRLPEVYDRAWRQTVGWFDRTPAWWDARLFYDPEHRRGGATALRFVLHEEPDGQVTGYAMYRVKWNGPEPDSTEVQVIELAATTTTARAAVWWFLLNLDLTNFVTWRFAPLDEPLQHLILDPRAVELEVADSLWIRLADIGRALAERSYSNDIDVVLDVSDELCGWNAGRWRLRGGADGAECVPTSTQPDLALSATELGAAYLGGTSLASLAAAGRVAELTPGALAATTRAFSTDREPWCPEVF
jgi:predicted acetyltransferase